MNNLKYLAGIPVSVDDIFVYPLKLREIAELGEYDYQSLLNLLTFNPEDKLVEHKFKDTSTFEIIIANLFRGSEDIIDLLQQAFAVFFKSEASVDEQNGRIILDNIKSKNYLTQENYEQIKIVLLEMNCITKDEKKEYNPKGLKAREIIEKMKKGKERLQSNNVPLTLFDLVSIYATHGKSDITTVWEYTIYQFNDQFQRMRMFDNCQLSNQINVQALVNGGKDIKFEDYMKKLK